MTLQDHGIFHVINVSRTTSPELNLVFRLHKDPERLYRLKTSARATIRDVLQQLKPLIDGGENEVFLVYVGKPLNIFKKFMEEYV